MEILRPRESGKNTSLVDDSRRPLPSQNITNETNEQIERQTGTSSREDQKERNSD